MLGIHESLEPVLVEEYSDNFEIIVAEIKVANKNIRVINAYGPQECCTRDENMPFFNRPGPKAGSIHSIEVSVLMF